MTEGIVTSQVVRERMANRTALDRLGQTIGQQQSTSSPPVGTRRGTVKSVSTIGVGQEPFYTVTVDGVDIPGVRNVSRSGMIAGDSVLLMKTGPDWFIMGAVGLPQYPFSPDIATDGTGAQQPDLGSGGTANGYYTMLTSTQMKVYAELKFGSGMVAGSGATHYQITGLPRAVLYRQIIPVYFEKNTAAADRRPCIGVIQGGGTTITRIVTYTMGSQSANEGMDTGVGFGVGGGFIAEGVLEVQP